jgi:pyruvate/2-oxoglutarate dehydrogenase complex dihydrolipoamide acyltransferase (E2) component
MRCVTAVFQGPEMPVTVFASARAAALAAELGLADVAILGTGRDGKVTVADVRAAAVPGPRLGAAGRALTEAVRAAVAEDAELDEREEAILHLAARQMDDLALLEELIAREGVAARGSTKQRIVHPALLEARQARLAISRLLGLIDLEANAGAAGTSASRRGRIAAAARWQNTGTSSWQG